MLTAGLTVVSSQGLGHEPLLMLVRQGFPLESQLSLLRSQCLDRSGVQQVMLTGGPRKVLSKDSLREE